MKTTEDSSPLAFPEDFRTAVIAQLAVVGLSVIEWEPNGVHVCPADGKEQYIGLANLHRRAKAADPSEWPELIRGFLERLATTKALIASTLPSLVFAAPSWRCACAALAASIASTVSVLPLRRRSWRLGRSTSTTSIPARRR